VLRCYINYSETPLRPLISIDPTLSEINININLNIGIKIGIEIDIDIELFQLPFLPFYALSETKLTI